MTHPYTGYIRTIHRPWEPVCSAPTWLECWALLLAIRRPGPALEKIVSRGHPDRRGIAGVQATKS